MNTNKRPKTVLLILAAMVLGGVEGDFVVEGITSKPIKSEETASSSVERSSSSSSSSKSSSNVTKYDGNTATTIEAKSDESTKVVQEPEKETTEPEKSDDTPNKVASSTQNPEVDEEYVLKSIKEETPAKEGEIYTTDGVLRYATTDPEMLAVRKVLLERWAHYTGLDTAWNMVRLNEGPGGFSVSSGGVNWGSITDEGNGEFTFQIKASSTGEPGYRQPHVTKGRETIR